MSSGCHAGAARAAPSQKSHPTQKTCAVVEPQPGSEWTLVGRRQPRFFRVIASGNTTWRRPRQKLPWWLFLSRILTLRLLVHTLPLVVATKGDALAALTKCPTHLCFDLPGLRTRWPWRCCVASDGRFDRRWLRPELGVRYRGGECSGLPCNLRRGFPICSKVAELEPHRSLVRPGPQSVAEVQVPVPKKSSAGGRQRKRPACLSSKKLGFPGRGRPRRC